MLVEKLRNLFESLQAYWDPFFRLGFICGLTLPVILLLLGWLVYRSRQEKHIAVEDSNGLFAVSLNALNAFLRHIIAEFPLVDLRHVKFTPRHDLYDVQVSLTMQPGADIKAVRNTLRERFLTECENKLGIAAKFGRVDILVNRIELNKEEPEN